MPAPSHALASGFAQDVLDGLAGDLKSIPPKYFYDERGSRLFEAITRTPEYYPTRMEAALLKRIAPEVAGLLAKNTALVEFGSGSSRKTRILLDAAPHISSYLPIDISPHALFAAARVVQSLFPRLRVTPVLGDFTEPLNLPEKQADGRCLGFFPGSTLGNFSPSAAVNFLIGARRLLGPEARLLIGIDIVKDEATLVRAYDDADNVTATFNKNLLVRINRELGGDIDLSAFAHRALWNAAESRVEMHLVSRRLQSITVAGRSYRMARGETIHTESSHKFTLESFFALADRGGWAAERAWISPPPRFGAFLLRSGPCTA